MENLVDQLAPFKSQRLIQLIKLKKAAFLYFVNRGFDRNSAAWENYCIVRNQANNAVRDAKKRAMNAVLIDPWQKIEILQGKNQQRNNVIDEMHYLGSKFAERFEIDNNLDNYFSNIGVNKLSEEAKFMKNGNGWTTAKTRDL